MDAAEFAAGYKTEPGVDDFVRKGANEPQPPRVSTGAAVVAALANVTALANAVLPLYVSITGGTPTTRPAGLPKHITALPRTSYPFSRHEEGIVVFDLFSSIADTD